MPGGPRVTDNAIRHNRETSLARYHANPGQAKKTQKAYRERSFESRKFIGWDGEGYNAWQCGPDGIEAQHRYMLFGASTGDYITGLSLGTAECLQLILDVEAEHRSAYHVGFAFEYDINMILKDLPWRTLAILKEQGYCRWKDPVSAKRFRIEHVPHKWFRVSCKGASATIFDVFGFFHCSYLKALDKHGIGSEAKRRRISAGKSARGLFTFGDIESVTEYWQAEISLLPSLMEEIRSAAYRANYRISEWHGPGALANYLLREMSVNTWHSKAKNTPPEVKSATRYAYAGGRFTPSLCGLYYGPVYTADLNSAYIYACSLLPRMDRGKWIRHNGSAVDGKNLARFGIYYIEFDAGPERRSHARKACLPEPPYPLFHRSKNGVLRWPRRTRGWYWTPEAQLVANSPRATILEAWVWDDDGSYPFRFVNDAFARRLELQEQENPVEKILKWALAAMYGAFARRVGWDTKLRKAPPTHELAWAGFITSWCRANVWGPAIDVYIRGKGRGLVSIDTDGITSTVPFRPETLVNGVGKNLGEWKLEEWTGILQWQNGIYWLRDSEGEWKDPKTRGIPKGAIPFAAAYEAVQRMDYSARPFVHPSLSLQRTRFVGYGQALRSQFSKWRQWLTEPVRVLMGGNPMGKAFHFPLLCSACRAAMAGNKPAEGSLESMHTITGTSPDTLESWPHKLPWLEEQPEIPDETTDPEFNLIVKDGDM